MTTTNEDQALATQAAEVWGRMSEAKEWGNPDVMGLANWQGKKIGWPSNSADGESYEIFDIGTGRVIDEDELLGDEAMSWQVVPLQRFCTA